MQLSSINSVCVVVVVVVVVAPSPTSITAFVVVTMMLR